MWTSAAHFMSRVVFVFQISGEDVRKESLEGRGGGSNLKKLSLFIIDPQGSMLEVALTHPWDQSSNFSVLLCHFIQFNMLLNQLDLLTAHVWNCKLQQEKKTSKQHSLFIDYPIDCRLTCGLDWVSTQKTSFCWPLRKSTIYLKENSDTGKISGKY